MAFTRPLIGRLQQIVAIVALCCGSPQLFADEPIPASVSAFMKQHCLRCHGSTVRKSGLRLDDLGGNFLEGRTADSWKEVIDRINLGEMPPEDEPQPDPEAALAFVEWVNRQLKAAEQAAHATGGRTLMRRLNRAEYAHTVGDLFQLNPNFVAQLREELPADGRAEGFDRISTALYFDRTQLEKYLAAADAIAREVIQDAPPPLARGSWKVDPSQLKLSPTTKITDTDHEIPRGPSFAEPKRDGVEFISGQRTFQKSLENAGLTGLPGQKFKLNTIVRRDGYYRLRVRAGAFTGARGGPVRVHFQYGTRPLKFAIRSTSLARSPSLASQRSSCFFALDAASKTFI